MLKCTNDSQSQTHFLFSSRLTEGQRFSMRISLHAFFWVASLFLFLMYTTILHPLRKAYKLSLLEYCVLEEIRVLSLNLKYGGWCIKSKQNIADSLDVSKMQIHRIINTLLSKKLIEKNGDTKHIRTTDGWNALIADKSRYAIAINTDSGVIVSGELAEEQNVTIRNIMLLQQEHNVTPSSNIMLHKNNIENNNSIVITNENISELKNCFSMIENVGKLIRRNVGQVNALLDIFILEQQAKGELNRSLGELRKHFTSWAKLNHEKHAPQIQKPKQYKEVPSVDGAQGHAEFLAKLKKSGKKLPFVNQG